MYTRCSSHYEGDKHKTRDIVDIELSNQYQILDPIVKGERYKMYTRCSSQYEKAKHKTRDIVDIEISDQYQILDPIGLRVEIQNVHSKLFTLRGS
ncbi:hypothetical protein AVEN_219255-1 [Araneus ventricosus]|uniref:Uncharacterized protein n=1 Tax=Araneus ventricosus TaxID=182803 RepID=A0A4Y2L3H5_ARAVE|nr:hypothetical protein AVEN_219255-1 [Araneus ventricosus]